MRQWVDECCITDAQNNGKNQDTIKYLFENWTKYALENGEQPGTTKWFSQAMQRFGFVPGKINTVADRGKRSLKGVAVIRVAGGGKSNGHN